MNRKIAALLVALSIVAGVGVGIWFSQQNSGGAEADAPKPTNSSAPPTDETDPDDSTEESAGSGESDSEEPRVLGDVFVGTGKVGPVVTGTPVKTAVDDGWLETDTERADRCGGGPYYRFADPVARNSLSVEVTDGTIQTVTVSGEDRYRTRADQGLGTTYAQLQTEFGADLSEVAYNDNGAPYVTYDNAGGWITFLIEEQGSVADSSEVFAMVVSQQQPTLLNDGC